MFGDILLSGSFLWDCVWQSSVCLIVGALVSLVWWRRPVRAHRLLLLAMVVALIAPVLSRLVHYYGWGLLPQRTSVIKGDPVVLDTPAASPSPVVRGEVNPAAAAMAPGPVEHSKPPPVAGPDRPVVASTSGKGIIAPSTFQGSWETVAVWAWIALGALGLVRFAVSVVHGFRLLSDARPRVSGEIRSALAVAAAKLGVTRVPKLYTSDRVRCPAMWCWSRHPSLLLPTRMDHSDNSTDWVGIFCHELAHLKRGDHVSTLFGELFVCFLPWHPLGWWCRRRLRRLSEQACDEWALSCGGAAPTYAESLVNMAAQPRPALALATVSSKAGLIARIRRILEAQRSNPRLGLRWGIAATLVTVAILSILSFAQTRPADKQPPEDRSRPSNATSAEDAERQKGQTLDLQVINRKTKKLLADVDLEMQIFENGKSKVWWDETDVQGRCQIKVPPRGLKNFRIYPTKEGFVPLRLYWEGNPVQGEMPKTLTVAMEPGAPIGGIIQNENGEPIEGVTVCLHYLRPDPDAAANARVNVWLKKVRTDKDGRWRCDFMPAEFDDLRILLRHPDYLSNNWENTIPMPLVPVPPVEKLREFTSVMLMKKGVHVTGTVVDREGKPIPGATISNREHFGRGKGAARTDAQGRFRLNHVKPGQMILVVQASGYAPELEEILVKEGLAPIECRLGPGQTMRGRVIDMAGKPIENASVYAEGWRGHQARLHLETKTDPEGRFRLTDAPLDGADFDIRKDGYMVAENCLISPSDGEVTITLKPVLRVRGTVVDAETGKPIRKLKVLTGIDRCDGSAPRWDVHSVKTFRNGRYEVEFRQETFSYRIRMDAEGYQPAVSRLIEPHGPDEGEVVYDFNLRRAEATTGVVVSSAGKALGGADVIIATHELRIRNGKLDPRFAERNQLVRTDAQGRFRVPPSADPYVIVVLHDKGYAKVTQEQFGVSPKITVEPWGRVEGTLRIGSKPGARMTMGLIDEERMAPPPARSAQGAPRIRCEYEYEAQTDAYGRFVFPRVVPGNMRLLRKIPIEGGGWSYGSSGVKVQIFAGKTTRANIGGTGRTVVGRLVVPLGTVTRIQWAKARLRIRTQVPEPSLPEGWDQMTQEQKDKWGKAWMASEEGKGYVKAMQSAPSFYYVDVRDDGTFRAEDIPPGNYLLSGGVFESSTDPQARREVIGAVKCDFIVPETKGSRSDEPLDLGEVQVELTPPAAKREGAVGGSR